MTLGATAPPRTRKPRGQGPSRRGEILRAATRIFIEEGVGHATMRRIAAEVGVSTTALYVYFPDKDAILQAIAEATFADLLRALAASQVAGEPAERRLRTGLRTYVAFGLARPDEYRLVFVAAPPAGAEPRERIRDADHSFAILERAVAELMAEGRFRPAPAELVAEAIWACLHGVTMLLIGQREHIGSPPERLVEQVLDMAVAGCR